MRLIRIFLSTLEVYTLIVSFGTEMITPSSSGETSRRNEGINEVGGVGIFGGGRVTFTSVSGGSKGSMNGREI